MKINTQTIIIIKYGKNQQDEFKINADVAEIRWDGNSFIIRGLFKKDKIKVSRDE